MGVSDKTMHFVAYLTLTVLLWFSTSTEQKVNWKKLKPWLLSAIILFYGAADEFSQQFVGRSTDLRDFIANFFGVSTAMLLVTIFPVFYVITTLITIGLFFLPAFVRSQLIKQNSIFEIAAYMAGFTVITIAWIKYLPSVLYLNFKKFKSLPVLFTPPAVTVVAIKIYAELTDKPFGATAISTAFITIILILLIRQMTIKKTFI